MESEEDEEDIMEIEEEEEEEEEEDEESTMKRDSRSTGIIITLIRESCSMYQQLSR